MKLLALIFVVLMTLCVMCSAKDDCPVICPAHYQGICATNGDCYKIFGNSCNLEYANCRADSAKFTEVPNGECEKLSNKKCLD